MNITTDSITLIEKELLDSIHFPPQEVLMQSDQIILRESNAKKAIKLGNLFKDKVKVIFEDSEGIKMIQTTVWGMTERYLIFKRGMILPLHRIHKIII
jgi:accessory colonization factor AcfC